MTRVIFFALIFWAIPACLSAQIEPEEFQEALKKLQMAPVQYEEVGDIKIAYKTIGEGEPLFCVTGNGDTMDAWSPLFIHLLAENRKVFIFDNRGAGLTSEGTKTFSIKQFAKDTVGFIRAMGYEKTDLLGFSMGSRISAQLTIDQPELISKVILYGCAPGGKQEVQRSAKVQKEFSDTSGTQKQKTERMLEILIPKAWLDAHPDRKDYLPPVKETISPEVRAKQNAAVKNWPGIYDQLSSIKLPTLILAGTADEVIPPGNALMIAGQIESSWLVRFRDGGHGMMFQFPAAMGEVVNTFLATSN